MKQHRLVLQDGARHAARFYVKGLSSQAGPRPRWLEACTAHLVTGLTPGSAVLDLDVLITGTAHYRPSGSIQQIAVDDLHRAEPRDDLFAHIPLPPSRQPVFRSLPHDQRSGVASFVGTWPGDESDAELIEALQAIR